MSEASELEAKLQAEQANYLKRLEDSGRLPTVISEAWNAADQGGTAKLRTEEADLLKGYVSKGAESREKYKDVWDPFKRDTLAAQNTALAYAPIADVRKELAMRAEALGLATQSAVAMYGAETNRAETNLGFTESAYNRALQREQEQTRQRERAEDLAIAAKKAASGGSKAVTKTEATADARDTLSALADKYKKMDWGDLQAEASQAGFDPVFTRDYIYQQALKEYPQLSASVIKAMVYNDYFPDDWR